MCQPENPTQPHMFASTVCGNQQDVRLVCQMLLARLQQNLLHMDQFPFWLVCPADGVGDAKNSTVLQLCGALTANDLR